MKDAYSYYIEPFENFDQVYSVGKSCALFCVWFEQSQSDHDEFLFPRVITLQSTLADIGPEPM